MKKVIFFHKKILHFLKKKNIFFNLVYKFIFILFCAGKSIAKNFILFKNNINFKIQVKLINTNKKNCKKVLFGKEYVYKYTVQEKNE